MPTITLNGKKVEVEEETTILQVAEKNGIHIPTLCYHEALEPAGLCRLCTVEIFDGRRTRFVTACNYPIRREIDVKTHSEAVIRHRKIIVEFLLARCPNNEFVKELAAQFGVKTPRTSVEDDDCILCGLCYRVCERIGQNGISISGRGTKIEIAPPFNLDSEACMACGACAAICPTGHIKMEEVGDEIIIKAGETSIKRVKMERCAVCGTPYAPAMFIEGTIDRIGDAIPAYRMKRDVCPACARQLNAERLALGTGGILAV
jgi:NADH dehydrogenase/NADH:ubiquinone oxidoreductase subunit G